VETLFFSFFPCFSLSSLLLRAKTLFSLSSCLLLLRRESSGGGGGGAVAGRPRRRRLRLKCVFLKKIFAYSLLLSPLYTFLGLKFPNFLLKCLDLRKERKEIYTFVFSFVFSVLVLVLRRIRLRGSFAV